MAVQPKGPKYTKAEEWGVHIVTFEWLIKCVFAGQRLPESDFPVLAIDEHECEKQIEVLDTFVLEKLKEYGCVCVPAEAPG